MTARAAIYGCAGPRITAVERAFFRDAQPWGFILFARNVETPDQVAVLVEELRGCVGRAAPILIDQEGGPVQRLRPPHWRAAPPAAVFGALYARAPQAALEAARVNASLIASELHACGIDVNCAPVLDMPASGADPVIGERAFATDPDAVAALGRATLMGLAEGGVAGVMKHIPGHGRALVDSHHARPLVAASRAELEGHDFAPFYALASAAPMAMTAHVIYSAYDGDATATTSPTVVRDVIRGVIGFDGLLMTDDLSMKALGGTLTARAVEALAAGCDMLLHCNGDVAEMEGVAAAAPALSGEALRRARAAEDARGAAAALDLDHAHARLKALLAADRPAGSDAIA